MNAGALPFAVMALAVALTLTFVPWRTGLIAVAGVALSALAVMLLPIAENFSVLVFAGFWLSAIAAAGLVLIPQISSPAIAICAALNAGVWFGALASVSEFGPLELITLFLALFFIPGRWIRCRGHEIVLKVLSSWLIAVSAVATLVSLVPTPGYEPDHME